MTYDRAAFFAAVRGPLFGGTLTDDQVAGLNAILDEWGRLQPAGDIRQFAYVLATPWWETNHTMQPVKEAYWLSEDWRRAHLRYYPFYGRGLVQITWQPNYAKATKRLREEGVLTASEDLVATPDLALRSDVAAAVLVLGMVEGWFTGKKLATYFTATVTDYVGARRIINGTDKADHVAAAARSFFLALRIAAPKVVSTIGVPPVAPKPKPALTVPALPAAPPMPPPAAPGFFGRIAELFHHHA